MGWERIVEPAPGFVDVAPGWHDVRVAREQHRYSGIDQARRMVDQVVECVAMMALGRFRSNDVIDVLADLFIEYGQPEHIRYDNGPELAPGLCRCALLTALQDHY